MLDVVPAQFADVAQAIHAADVNKGTVGSQALDNASVLLVNFNVLPELIALCLSFEHYFDHQLDCFVVHFSDFEQAGFALLMDLLLQIPASPCMMVFLP